MALYKYCEPNALRNGNPAFTNIELAVKPHSRGYAIHMVMTTAHGYVQEQHTKAWVDSKAKALKLLKGLEKSIAADKVRPEGTAPLRLDIAGNWWIENFYNLATAPVNPNSIDF